MANWIQNMHMDKGGLHRALGVPIGTRISAKKMQQAHNSKNAHIRRMANLADTLKGLHG